MEIYLLHALKTHAPDDFGWRMAGRGAYFVDRLLGSDRPRLALDDGASAEEVFAGWDAQAAGFEERTRPHRLYT